MFYMCFGFIDIFASIHIHIIIHYTNRKLCECIMRYLYYKSSSKIFGKPWPVPSGIRYTFRVRLPGLAGRPESRMDSAAYFLAVRWSLWPGEFEVTWQY